MTRATRRTRRPPEVFPVAITVTGEVATLTIERALRSPDSLLLGRHWKVYWRESRAWKVSIRVALLDYLNTLSRTDAAKRELAIAAVHTGALPKAPEGKYRVRVTRVIGSARDRVADGDNLGFTVKPLLDALVHNGIIFDDSRQWLDLPGRPRERKGDRTATIVTVSPWWRSAPQTGGQHG